MTTIDLRPETGLGAFTLEALDFTPELPCEHANHGRTWNHEGAGAVVIERVHACAEGQQMILCRKAWDIAGELGVDCPRCGEGEIPRSQVWLLVAVL